MKRRDKTNYYLDIAQTVLERGTCLRRNVGAIIVKNDIIVSTGYAGAPRGRANCSDLCVCRREQLGVPRGQRYELCRSVHAEQNCIIAASRDEMLGSTLYLTMKDAVTDKLVPDASPCNMCRRMIINAGIEKVIVRNSEEGYTVFDVQKDFVEADDTLPEDQLNTY